MKKLLFVIGVMFMIVLFSCTENQRVKKFGGNATITLPKGKKLINATWKDSNLWYLTRNMKPGETAEEYTFAEESNFGLVQGTYTIKEQE